MARVIAVTNQKGGVGKTTTVINLGCYLTNLGKKTLIIDFDPQGNTGSGLGVNINQLKHSVYSLLIENSAFKECLIEIDTKNLFILPSNIDLAGWDIDLLDVSDKENILKKIIFPIHHDFDFILIDCPPSLGILTLNALTAATSTLIPLQCEYFALEGLAQLLRVIRLVQSKLNPQLSLEGILMTMYDSRTKLSFQVVQDVKKHFTQDVFEIIIPRSIRLSEAPSFGKPINRYAPDSHGALAYQKLAKEIITKYE